MRRRDQTLHCLLSSQPRGIQKPSLSLTVAVLQWPWPEFIWYYSQLNVEFTEAARIKRATARTYLVLCNAENGFADVFLYTNIMSWGIV